MIRKIIVLGLLAMMALSANAQQQQPDSVADGKTPARVYFQNGKVHFRSDNGKFHLWLDNRVNLEAAVYSPSESVDGLTSKANKDLENDDTHFRFSNGVIVRRARFGIKAELYNWFAEFDVDFAFNEVELKDMFLGYKFNDHWSAKLGNFKVPMSMERLTSSKYLTMAERPMPVEAFADGRCLGLAGTGWGRGWWASAGVFGRSVDILQKERNRGGDGWAVAGRVAFSPINTSDMTVHIGGYANYRRPAGDGATDHTVLFRTLPESRVDHRRFVQAEVENVDNYTILGWELGFRYDKFLAYGEYVFNTIARHGYENLQRIDLKNATFNGWYAQASYMILGSSRQYSPEDAEFGPMKINRRGGNLEVAARVSNINMNDWHDSRAYITGGKSIAWSGSLNWYPISNVAVGLSYTYVNNDKYADSKGQITCNGRSLKDTRPDGIDFGIFQMRAAVSF
ncbi:MAG: OprO/OprP family phosphate-selective porin [Muribaculaceae bacterium]